MKTRDSRSDLWQKLNWPSDRDDRSKEDMRAKHDIPHQIAGYISMRSHCIPAFQISQQGRRPVQANDVVRKNQLTDHDHRKPNFGRKIKNPDGSGGSRQAWDVPGITSDRQDVLVK